MNINRYSHLKRQGLCEIKPEGGGYAFVTKKYSQETGKEEAPNVQAVDVEQLIKDKKTLEDAIANIEEAIADIEQLS